MTLSGTRPAALPAILLAAALASASFAGQVQTATSTTEPLAAGPGGYVLNFQFAWLPDDNVSETTSSQGRIDLVDGNGVTVGQLMGTLSGGNAAVSAPSVGVLSNLRGSVSSVGAGGTPADATLTGTWRLPSLGSGPYSLRFWTFENSISGRVATTITTAASDAGGGGAVYPPSVTLSAPQAATVLVPIAVGATASEAANGNPLATVEVDASTDGGATWSPVISRSQASSPTDSEAGSASFALPGTATLRATATDAGGLQSTSEQSVAVSKAGQGAVTISPAAMSIGAGQSVAFTASGGATGNYAWSGSATGSGATQSVVFPSPGTYSLSVLDTGNAAFDPSATATATVSVQVTFYVLTVAAGPGGTVSGGGSYPPNSTATAFATAGPGEMFAGWTGDATGSSPSLSVLMSSSRSVVANFTALFTQSITFSAPGAVSTRTLPFTLVATASSGLPVTLSLNSGPASLAGAVLTPAGATGTVTVTATQPGNSRYLPAQPVTVSFPIGPPPAGVLLANSAPITTRTDRYTRTTSFTSAQAH